MKELWWKWKIQVEQIFVFPLTQIFFCSQATMTPLLSHHGFFFILDSRWRCVNILTKLSDKMKVKSTEGSSGDCQLWWWNRSFSRTVGWNCLLFWWWRLSAVSELYLFIKEGFYSSLSPLLKVLEIWFIFLIKYFILIIIQMKKVYIFSCLSPHSDPVLRTVVENVCSRPSLCSCRRKIKGAFHTYSTSIVLLVTV